MAIEKIPVRAEIYSGGTLGSLELISYTPYILSFNVSKNRGQNSSFNASIKLNSDVLNKIGKYIQIRAGRKGDLKTIFTGYVKKMVPNPSWDDPSFFIVNLSGTDALAELADKKITRRQTNSRNSWAKIDSVNRKGPKSGKFKFVKEPSIVVTDGDLSKDSQHNNNSPMDGSAINSDTNRERLHEDGAYIEIEQIIYTDS